MERQIFIQNEYGHYRETIANVSSVLYKLGLFLIGEVGIDENGWRERLFNKTSNEIFCNALYIRKEGETIVIGCFSGQDFECYPDAEEYKTTDVQCLRMISDWFRLHEERPNKIILEVEGEMIRLYGEE